MTPRTLYRRIALADRPPLVDPEQDRDEAEGDEDDAVGEPEDLDAEVRRARDVLEDHPEQEQRPRHHLREGDPAVERARGHAGVSYVVSYSRAQSHPPFLGSPNPQPDTPQHTEQVTTHRHPIPVR